MFCKHCGKQIENQSNFCPHCGKVLNDVKRSVSPNTMRIIYALTYVPILFWLPFAFGDTKPLGKQISNQSLLLLILTACVNLIFGFLEFVFEISYIFLALYAVVKALSVICSLGLTTLMIIGIISASQNKLFRIPIIGDITIIK